MAITFPKCHFGNPDDTAFCGKCGTQLSPSEAIPSRTETLETSVQELNRGATFAGRYEIIEELGRGDTVAITNHNGSPLTVSLKPVDSGPGTWTDLVCRKVVQGAFEESPLRRSIPAMQFLCLEFTR